MQNFVIRKPSGKPHYILYLCDNVSKSEIALATFHGKSNAERFAKLWDRKYGIVVDGVKMYE